MGTPKTLRYAIENALVESLEKGLHMDVHADYIIITHHIETHVRDFLAQKFSSAMLSDKALTELWESIIRKVIDHE